MPSALNIDIVAVPAIGADPHTTWQSTRNARPIHWITEGLHRLIPTARILEYDHLNDEERAIEVKPRSHPEHKQSAEQYAVIKDRIASFGVEQWTNRFLQLMGRYRNTKTLQARPLIFICHSTGGIVAKRALSHRLTDDVSAVDIAAACIAITFFSTPHHGSTVLSQTAFAQATKANLRLKWEMSEHLMDQLSPKNSELELLNHKFAAVSAGIRFWNFVETRDTELTVLAAGESSGANLTKIYLSIVAQPSARMTTSEVLIEDEIPFYMNTTHVGTARFADDQVLADRYCEELGAFIGSTSAHERAAHHALITSIMTDTLVDVHQFYETVESEESTSIKVWSEQPSLQEFLDFGASACLRRRLSPKPKGELQVDWAFQPMTGHTEPEQALLRARRLEIPLTPWPAPTIIVETPEGTPRPSTDTYKTEPHSNEVMPQLGRSARSPSPTRSEIRSGSPERYSTADSSTLAASTLHPPANGSTKSTERHRTLRDRTYQLPTKARDRFKWINIPYTHAGWVPQVLVSVSHEKGNPNLHTKLLSNPVWLNNHNKARFASSHARFVRPLSKSLLPKGSQNHHHDEMSNPTSATEQAQFALYLPYLHWDTFQCLQRRATVIRQRSKQKDCCPVDRDVARGRSIEHKLIWQYHQSNRPLHFRRTLDQYGYPSLRNTSVRDSDQVLYKRTRTRRNDEETHKAGSMQHIMAILHATRAPGTHVSRVKTLNDSHAKVLLVDQLWLFVMDDDTVISFVAPKERDDGDGGLYQQGDLRRMIYKDVNGDFSRRCDDCFDFAALAVYHAVTALLEHTDDKDLQVFRIFEEYISELTEQQTKSFKEFRDHHRYRNIEDHNVQQLPNYFDNRDDLDALLELRDIEDELGTIEKLLNEQHRCVQDMIEQYSELKKHKKGLNGHNLLKEVEHILDGYLLQVAGMKKSSEAAQEAFEKLLDMKQRQANIVEAHLTREQTEQAQEQNRSVLVFTVFTIIFLPLSFFASVFGINAREWSGVDTNPSLHHILIFMCAISLGFIVIALLVAFNRLSRKVMLRIWKWIGSPITRLVDRMPSTRLQRYVHEQDRRFDGARAFDLEKAEELVEIRQHGERRRSERMPAIPHNLHAGPVKWHREDVFGGGGKGGKERTA
ncbi:hypothetical protein MMC25_007414 [Agyrium rufum]|nr:hypothetical protein [Agyrium rufum]